MDSQVPSDSLGLKNEIYDDIEKYAVDSGAQFPAKSILRPMVFPETTR